MSEQKMREALERLAAYPYGRNDELGVAQMRSIAREALAQQPAAVVELTDDEIESVAHRSCSIYVHGRDQIYHRYEFGRLTIFDFATKLIQTYRAKQGGAA